MNKLDSISRMLRSFGRGIYDKRTGKIFMRKPFELCIFNIHFFIVISEIFTIFVFILYISCNNWIFGFKYY